MKLLQRRRPLLLLLTGLTAATLRAETTTTTTTTTTTVDVCVYGGTSGGVIAAVQAARLGKKVILIEPGRHLGGMSSSGLGMTDNGSTETIGGLSREFYQRVYRYYTKPESWPFQKREDLGGGRPAHGGVPGAVPL